MNLEQKPVESVAVAEGPLSGQASQAPTRKRAQEGDGRGFVHRRLHVTEED